MSVAPTKPRKKATLKDVADAAKVSTATASLALRSSPRISPATSRRVNAAAASLDYVYNQRAASLRTQRSSTIGLIVRDMSNPYSAELTSGAEAALARQDYSLLLAADGGDPKKQTRLIRTMLERGVDGLLLSPVTNSDLDALRKVAVYCPLVLLTPYYPQLAADSVGMADEVGTARAVEHLIEQGHRRIAFIGGYDQDETRRRRLHSYRQTLQRWQIDFDPALCVESPTTRRGGYEAVRQLLRIPQPAGSAFCYSDVIAFGVILGLRAAGIEAGRDFAVVGFDDVEEASLWQPSLTSVATDPTGMGEKAAQLMLRRIAEPDMTVQRVIMPSRLIKRDSTASG